MRLPQHPTLQHYKLTQFNCTDLYEKELKNINHNSGILKYETIIWQDKNKIYHRKNKPAIIGKSRCIWVENGLFHREEKPAAIYERQKQITWYYKGTCHRIGGFAEFSGILEIYDLYVEKTSFENPYLYVKNAKEWLMENYSAHDCIEKFHELNEVLDLGYLDKNNWSNGIFKKQ